jgi:3-oxoacyl-[acyl-carrier protein] reductase
VSEQPLQGKVALVTGAASATGLGRAMALALIRAGARVAILDIDEQGLNDRTNEARLAGEADSVTCIVGNVANPEDAERAVQETVARLGALHILVNNAGINPSIDSSGSWISSTGISPEAWVEAVGVNITGPFLMARAAARHLVTQGWGRIIGITTSFDTMIRSAPYGPSKAAHEALVAVMARELDGTGVTANVLIPGRAANTEMAGRLRNRRTLLPPEVMQEPIVWLASASSDGFNGRRLIAEFWDEALPLDERLAKASMPAAWPQLGRQATKD